MQRSAFLLTPAILGVTHDGTPRAFDAATFARTFDRAADVRQVWDAAALAPHILGSVRNALSGLHSAFAIPEKRIATAFVARKTSTLLLYDNVVWARFRLGLIFGVKDPAGVTVSTNVFAETVRALHARGVLFCVCNTALTEQAGAIVRAGASDGESAEAVAAALREHLLANAMLVPSGVAAVAYLQARLNYAYLTDQAE